MESLPKTCVNLLTGHKGTVICARLNDNGNYLFTGGHDQLVKLWNPIKGKLVYTFVNGHSSEVLDVSPFVIFF
jgi:WD40 repeat protein